jgi:hypothetical protein
MNNEPFDPERFADVARVLAEFRDQPTLCLTVDQTARLFQLDAVSASAVLDVLTRNGYLRHIGTRFCNSESQLMACGCGAGN